MREILFRGKRIDNGEWIEGNFGKYALGNGEKISCISIPKANSVAGSLCYDVEPETVGQYTGLTDKNGKKIFEGDIIHVNYTISVPAGVGPLLRIVKHSIDYKSVVAFENCRFCLKKQNGEIFEMHLVPGEVEVIGNIHDNPELLEVEE